MVELIGQRISNYQIQGILGRGGFADVYIGRHIYLGSYAAIKLLHSTVVGDNNHNNFIQEARILAQLSHPHIIRILEFGIEFNMAFLIMDYAPNGSLRQRHTSVNEAGQTAATTVPLATVIEYVRQIAGALQHAHERRCIHRDLKPDNILIDQNNKLLVSDFGLARAYYDSVQSSEFISKNVSGTLPYMAPEQFEGKARFANDQYSLAVMVYEWLSGTLPFHGNFLEIFGQHITGILPPPLSMPNLAIPFAVEQVVFKALSKDYHNRFADIMTFAQALEQSQHMVSLDLSTPATPLQQPFDLSTPATPLQQPFDLSTSTAPLQPPFDLSTPATPLQQPFDLSTPATPLQQPFDLSTSTAPLQPPFDLSTPATPLQQPFDLSTPAAPLQQPFDLSTSTAPLQPPFDLPTSAAPLQQPEVTTGKMGEHEVPPPSPSPFYRRVSSLPPVSSIDSNSVQKQDGQPAINKFSSSAVLHSTSATPANAIRKYLSNILIVLVALIFILGSSLFFAFFHPFNGSNTQHVPNPTLTSIVTPAVKATGLAHVKAKPSPKETPTLTPTLTPTTTPALTPTTIPTSTPPVQGTPPGGIQAWKADNSNPPLYKPGDEVTYNGNTYKCLQQIWGETQWAPDAPGIAGNYWQQING